MSAKTSTAAASDRVEELEVSVFKQVSHHKSGLAALRDLQRIRADLDLSEHAFVQKARTQGATWAEVGAALGITQQGASARFAKFDLPRG